MKLVSKAAAFGAAAALSATGLVAASGAANAASAPTYTCNVVGDSTTTFTVPLHLSVPSPVTGTTIPAGTPLSGTADVSDLIAKGTDAPGTPAGALVAGLKSGMLTNLTATPGAFAVKVQTPLGAVALPLGLTPETLDAAGLANLAKGDLPVVGKFVSAMPVTLPAGTYPLSLPNEFKLDLSSVLTSGGDATALGSVDCNASTPQSVTLTIKPAASTTPVTNPGSGSGSGSGAGSHATGKTAAQKKLAKDKAKLKKAKKALKKAHGAKKAKLHKKVVKLKKAVKKDQKAVKAGK